MQRRVAASGQVQSFVLGQRQPLHSRNCHCRAARCSADLLAAASASLILTFAVERHPLAIPVGSEIRPLERNRVMTLQSSDFEARLLSRKPTASSIRWVVMDISL